MQSFAALDHNIWDGIANSTRTMSSAVLNTVGTLNQNLRRRMRQAAVKAHLSSNGARSTSKPFDFYDKPAAVLQGRSSMAGSVFGSPTGM